MDKIMLTHGGSLKAVDEINDSWDFVEAMKDIKDIDLYAKVAAVYRAANLTADATSNMPFAVMKGDQDIDTSDQWTNVIGVMPNPRELIRLWRMSLFFTNTAYARLAKTNAIKRRLWYVAPHTMRIETDPVNGEVSEIIRGEKEHFKPDDKSLLKMWRLDFTTELLPSPNTEFLAMSQAAGILLSADFWTQNYFRNGAVKPTVVAIKGAVGTDKKDELQSAWAKFMRGLGKRFSDLAKVINADAMEVKQLGDGLGDIKDSPVYKQAIENIAMASGMPLSLLLANSANYATAQAEYAAWFRDSITPWAMWMAEELNYQIFQPAGLYFEFRPEAAEPSQQEEVERASAFSTYVSSGLLPSIAAQLVGLDLPAGIEYEDLDPDEPEPVQTPPTDTQPVEEMSDTDTPEPDKTEPMKAMSFDAWQELDIWKRKATKAQKRGEDLPVEFVCRHIPAAIAEPIRDALKAGRIEFDVKRDEPHDDIKQLADALNNAADAIKAKHETPDS